MPRFMIFYDPILEFRTGLRICMPHYTIPFLLGRTKRDI